MLMKPNPHLVNAAIQGLGAATDLSALVGDQVSDIIAARNASVQAIGYANKEGKTGKFVEAGADLIVASMGDLFRYL
jgi:phosphoglycolate phosphatase-like HAD superfamily hydrolase